MSTTDFGKAVIENLGAKPKKLTVSFVPKDHKPIQVQISDTHYSSQEKVLEGVDVFVCYQDRNPNALAEELKTATQKNDFLKLSYITNRGIKVYPDPNPETFCTDHWRCRFLKTKEDNSLDQNHLISLLQDIVSGKIEIIKTENLYSFSGEKNYSQIG